MSAAAADILDRAADVIVERGWCQWQYEDAAGYVCVAGAIRCAAAGSPRSRHNADMNRAYAALRRHAGIDNPPAWNDQPERVVDEVIAALRETAAAERGRVDA